MHEHVLKAYSVLSHVTLRQVFQLSPLNLFSKFMFLLGHSRKTCTIKNFYLYFPRVFTEVQTPTTLQFFPPLCFAETVINLSRPMRKMMPQNMKQKASSCTGRNIFLRRPHGNISWILLDVASKQFSAKLRGITSSTGRETFCVVKWQNSVPLKWGNLFENKCKKVNGWKNYWLSWSLLFCSIWNSLAYSSWKKEHAISFSHIGRQYG